jgi:plastocyanin
MAGSKRLCARVLGAALAIGLFAPAGSAFAQDADATVTMVGISFAPLVVHVAPGATVAWVNTSTLAHTVTADDGSFDSGSVDPDGTYLMTFDTPGTYQYFCQPHGAAGLKGMAATVVVDDPTAAEVTEAPIEAAPKPLPTPDPNPAEYYPDH